MDLVRRQSYYRWLSSLFLIGAALWMVVVTSRPSRPSPAAAMPVTFANAASLATSLNDRFGFDFVNGVTEASARAGSAETWYQRARAAGAGWTRWPMYWHRIETERGRYDYSSSYPVDRVVELDVRFGLRTNAILLGTPSWGGIAGQVGPVYFDVGRKHPPKSGIQVLATGSPAAVPQGLDRPVFLADGSINPENVWARFVYTTVNRYKPGGELARILGWGPGQGITHWEMWNEPDLLWNIDGRWVGAFWLGTPEDYYRLLKAGYLAAKAADPNAVVLFGGLSYWSQKDFLPRVLDRLVADPEARSHNYFFDVLPLHFYVNAEDVYDKPQWARGEMQKRGFNKPIWLNETNAPIWGDSTTQPFGPWLANLDEQASFVIHAHAYAIAAGVERAFVFQLYEDGEPTYGIIRNNDTPRPAYMAYQVAATYFAGAQLPSRSRAGQIEVISFYSPIHGKVTVVWNLSTAPVAASLPASAPSATLVDRYGGTEVVQASGGTYSLVLPAGSQYSSADIVWRYGGAPYILLERVSTNQLPYRVILPGVFKGQVEGR